MGTLWTKLLNRFEKFGSCNVTRRLLTLGARDHVTGWRKKTFLETTVKMVIVPRGSTSLSLVPGTYVRFDALGLTNTAFLEGDETKSPGGTYYEVKDVREHCLTPDTVEYYECDLAKLPLHSGV